MQPVPKEGKGILRPPSPDSPSLCLQRLSAETLCHQGLVERPVAVADPQLSLCPTDVQEGLQVSGTKLGWWTWEEDTQGGSLAQLADHPV